MPDQKRRRVARSKTRPILEEPEDVDTNGNLGPNGEIPSRHPWPKPDKKKIPTRKTWHDVPAKVALGREVDERPISEDWDDYDTLFYNAWTDQELEQTRIGDLAVVQGWKIKDDVVRLLKNAGLGTIATKHYPMYPELVRQFLATVRVYYLDEGARRPNRGFLTFMARGIRYRISLDELAGLYGLAFEDRDRIALPESLPGIRDFWQLFGSRVYDSKTTTQTDIRHPAIRYVVRLIAQTILCKNEPNKMRVSELIILFHGLCADFPELRIDGFPDDVHYGAVFAHHLVSLRKTPFELTSRTRKKAVTVGSLLTPIFRHCGIATTPCAQISQYHNLDFKSLSRARWTKTAYIWTYRDIAGNHVQVHIPLDGQQSIAGNLAALRFEPDPRVVRAVTDRPVSLGRASGGASSSTVPESLPEFPDSPEFPMEMEEFQRMMYRNQRTIYQTLQAFMQRFSGCIRPRSRSPSPAAGSVSEEDDDDDA